MSTPVHLQRSPAPVPAAKPDLGVGFRTVRGQSVDCLRWCGLGGGARSGQRLSSRGRRGSPPWVTVLVDLVSLDQMGQIRPEAHPARVRGSTHLFVMLTRHVPVELDAVLRLRNRLPFAGLRCSSSRHSDTLTAADAGVGDQSRCVAQLFPNPMLSKEEPWPGKGPATGSR